MEHKITLKKLWTVIEGGIVRSKVVFFFTVENTHFPSPCFTGMSVLNKTKWKGGTLQIELAKESFLHR